MCQVPVRIPSGVNKSEVQGHAYTYSINLIFIRELILTYLLPLRSRFGDLGPAVAVITNRDGELGHHHAREHGLGSLCDDTSDSLHHIKVHLQPLVRVIRLKKKKNNKSYFFLFICYELKPVTSLFKLIALCIVQQMAFWSGLRVRVLSMGVCCLQREVVKVMSHVQRARQWVARFTPTQTARGNLQQYCSNAVLPNITRLLITSFAVCTRPTFLLERPNSCLILIDNIMLLGGIILNKLYCKY